MKFSDDAVRRISSYRQESRETLKGRWGAALGTCLLLNILPLLPYALFALIPSVLPLDSISRMLNSPFSISTLNFIASSLVSVLYLIVAALLLSLLLQPFCKLGRARMAVALYTGDAVGPRVLSIGWKGYWKYVGLSILTYLSIVWPALLILGLETAALNVCTHVGAFSNAVTLLEIFSIVYSVSAVAASFIIIVRTFRYIPTTYLLAMHPDGSIRKIMRRSRSVMSGNKWRCFCLMLSFIGWLLLNVLFNGALTALLLFLSTDGAVLSALTVTVLYVVLSVCSALPLTVYQEVSITCFICDAGNKKRAAANE